MLSVVDSVLVVNWFVVWYVCMFLFEMVSP